MGSDIIALLKKKDRSKPEQKSKWVEKKTAFTVHNSFGPLATIDEEVEVVTHRVSTGRFRYFKAWRAFSCKRAETLESAPKQVFSWDTVQK